MNPFSNLTEFLETQGVQLLRGILTLVVGLFLVHWIVKLINRSEKYVNIEPTLKGFLSNLLKLILYVVVILTTASVLGIPMTSIIALVGTAGVAVSLAMQGALSNLVGGMTLLLLHPIRAGEFIKVGEFEGTVRSIGAFYTDLVTPDNRHISIPNSMLTNTSIINVTREGKRRMDIPFSVSFSSDMDRVKHVLQQVVESHPAVLPDPAPQVLLNTLGDSGLNYIIRLWAKNDDYWDVYFDLVDRGKRALDAAGITIPFPQMDIHMKQEKTEG